VYYQERCKKSIIFSNYLLCFWYDTVDDGSARAKRRFKKKNEIYIFGESGAAMASAMSSYNEYLQIKIS